MKNKLEALKEQVQPDFLQLFLVGSLCCLGLVHEFLACAAGIVLCVYLCVLVKKNKALRFYVNLSSLAVVLIVLGYAVSVFAAVDRGLAVLGFFKFLPLLLFMLVFMQQQRDADEYLKILPATAVFMTAVSFVCMQIPVLKNWFSVSGRLAGFFQYANTFALFLLVALVIVATKEKFSKADIPVSAVLIFGIFYSGSRTVFVLLVVAVVAMIVFGKSKHMKLAMLGVFVAGVLFVVIYAAATDNFRSISRFLTISLQESTFVGRLLYYTDALPVVLRHPFGLGHLGYYFYQQSVQTGVYAVRYVHNDFLQLLLDIGWVPALTFVAAIARSFFKKGTSLRRRVLLLVIAGHAFFDFDLQFVAVFMIFILLLPCREGKEKTLHIAMPANAAAATVTAALFLYIGIAQGLSYCKLYEASDRLYPWNTLNHIEIIKEADRIEEVTALADKVLRQNAYVPIAYDVKAKQAYSEGDFATVIEYKRQAIQTAPFLYESYEDYCYMLISGVQLYEQHGDAYSAEVCRAELLQVAQQLHALPQKCSRAGKLIEEQPKTELPADITAYIQTLQKASDGQ